MMIADLTPLEIDAVLAGQTLARIACQQDGRPYIVPVNYIFADGAVLVHSLEGAKITMMRDNPQVCVQVDEIETMTSWRSVLAWGRFEELRGKEARAALRALVTRLLPPELADGAGDPFAPPGMEDRVVLFRVMLDERHGRAAIP
jgi:uncharacterized protein